MTHLFVIKRQLLAYIFMCEDHRTNLTCADFSDIQYFFCGTFFVIKKDTDFCHFSVNLNYNQKQQSHILILK